MNKSCTRIQRFVSQNRFLLTQLKIFPRPIYQNWWILAILPPCSTCPWFCKPKISERGLSTQRNEYSSAGCFCSSLNLEEFLLCHSCIPLHHSLFACLESVFDQFANLILPSNADLHINSYTNNSCSVSQAPGTKNYHFYVQLVLNAFSNSCLLILGVSHLSFKKKKGNCLTFIPPFFFFTSFLAD